MLAEYRDQVADGSWLALPHLSDDLAEPAEKGTVERFRASYEGTSNPLRARGRAEIESWFPEDSLLSPGIVPIPEWRPDSPATSDDGAVRRFARCGVGGIRAG